MNIKFTRFAALFIILVVFIKNMWLGDDIFLTMRTLDNFVNGFGLVWNVGERVQIFTHPLWMLIILPFYYLLKSPYVTLYLISGIISLSVFFILLHNFAQNKKAVLFTTLAIVSSASFIDYSSSGLENPLSHLISLIFMLILFNENEDTQPHKKIFLLSLCASTGILTRYDTALLYIPALAFQVYKNRHTLKATLFSMIKGFTPLFLWELFSILYYGFLFPNTYYAKALTDLSLAWKIKNGAYYFANSLEWDPTTLLIVVASIILTFAQKNNQKKSVAFGVILYAIYILVIGGDFMAGRFFSNIFLIGLTLILCIDYPKTLKRFGNIGYISSVSILVIIGLQSKSAPVLYGDANQPNLYQPSFISNEKAFYSELGLIYHYKLGQLPDWGQKGLSAKKNENTPFYRGGGLFGYYAGPEIYLIDPYVLGDPLRARLPVETEEVDIGHYWRRVPAGYTTTITDNYNNHIKNYHLRIYYDRLSLIIHSDIFTVKRLEEIIKMNLGMYDSLLDLYMQEEPITETEKFK